MSPLNNVPPWIVSPFLKKLSTYKKEHYSNLGTFEIANLANVPGHYLRKYGNYFASDEKTTCSWGKRQTKTENNLKKEVSKNQILLVKWTDFTLCARSVTLAREPSSLYNYSSNIKSKPPAVSFLLVKFFLLPCKKAKKVKLNSFKFLSNI